MKLYLQFNFYVLPPLLIFLFIYMLDSLFRIFTPAMFGYLIGNLHVRYLIKQHIEKNIENNTVKNPIYDDQ